MRTRPGPGSISALVCALALCVGAPTCARAAVVIYTFEAPQFTVGETTPLVNRAPNVGSPAFRADFTSSPIASGFLVTSFEPNPLFTDNSLVDGLLDGVANTLTVTFNTPVDSVQFAFALNQSATGPFGQITLTSPVGNQTQSAANVGGTFQGGTFSFSSATPFTTFQLEAFTSTGARVELAIDNLTVTTQGGAVVPAPATLTLLAAGGLSLLGHGWRRRGRLTRGAA